MVRFLKNSFILEGYRHFKKIILEGRGFRGGSDEKMRRMWLGLEIVVAGLTPLGYVYLFHSSMGQTVA